MKIQYVCDYCGNALDSQEACDEHERHCKKSLADVLDFVTHLGPSCLADMDGMKGHACEDFLKSIKASAKLYLEAQGLHKIVYVFLEEDTWLTPLPTVCIRMYSSQDEFLNAFKERCKYSYPTVPDPPDSVVKGWCDKLLEGKWVTVSSDPKKGSYTRVMLAIKEVPI